MLHDVPKPNIPNPSQCHKLMVKASPNVSNVSSSQVLANLKIIIAHAFLSNHSWHSIIAEFGGSNVLPNGE